MRVAETIEIDRSPGEVWAFVADHANDPAWCKKVKSIEALGPRRWRVVHRPVPLRRGITLMVQDLEIDPPSRLKLREEDDASVFEVEYRLEAVSTGTRFTQTSEFEWKTLPRLLHRAFAHGVKRDVRNQLRTLKRVLESH